MATKKTDVSATDEKKTKKKAAPKKKAEAKKAPAKKAAPKKATAEKKPAEKKPATKKAEPKKPAAKKAEPKKKAEEKKSAAKKAAPTKKKATTAKKPAAKKPAAKKPATKKADAKKQEPVVETPEVETPADEAPAAPSPEAVAELIEELAGPNRRRRQDASHELGAIAQTHPEALENSIDELIDALYRPEAQTRWEVLLALAELAASYGSKLAGAFDGAEASLFDEGSATVRLAAFGFLACYGATSPKRSDDAWPLLDEAIQCYHGDSEYRDMLGYLLTFVRGKISKESRAALVDRVSFDATSGRGYVQVCSAEIIEAAKTKK